MASFFEAVWSWKTGKDSVHGKPGREGGRPLRRSLPAFRAFAASHRPLSAVLMAKAAPSPQEIAAALLTAAPALSVSLVGPDGERRVSIDPREDLLFNVNDKSFYFYSEGLWEPVVGGDITVGSLARTVHLALDANFPELPITDARIREVAHSMARVIPRISDLSSPPPFLAFRNGTLDLSSLELLPHSRDRLCLLGFPLDWPEDGVESPTPAWDAYLSSSLPEPEARTLLEEAIGYFLTPFDEEPAAFYLYGPQRTGKSRVFWFLYDLFGPRFASTFNLQALTTEDKNVAALVGKFVNLQDEDESERIGSDRFKALLDHSPMQARRLYEDPFQFRPFCKFLFCANQLPNFKQLEGISRRIRFIAFDRQVPVEAQDKGLRGKLMAEAPGIVRRCLLAFKAVRERNSEFTVPASSRALMDEFLQFVQPIRAFVDEWCEFLPADSPVRSWTGNRALYEAYDAWRTANGHKQMSSMTFHRQLSLVQGIRSAKIDDMRYKNLRLRLDWLSGERVPGAPLPPPKPEIPF